MTWRVLSVAVLWFLSVLPAGAQPAPPAQPPPQRPTLRLYVACNTSGCDYDFMRTELPFVDHMRDRKDADVYVLATGRSTGSGGTEVTLQFIGQGPFKGLDDEIVFAMGQNDSEDVRRRDFVQMLKLGLARYAARTDLGRKLVLTERKTGPAPPPGAPRSGKDPWNFWVFRISMNGNISGEQSSKNMSLSGSVNANRTTEAWKLNFSGSMSHSENRYTFSSGSVYTSVRRNYSSGALVVKSLTDHWSVGAKGSIGTSSYYNQDLAVEAAPAVEYNFFPYSQSTRRQFIVRYSIGYNYFRYKEVTLYGKETEALPSQRLLVGLDVIQPWGSVSGDVETSQYLNDLSKWRLSLSAWVSLKLLKGFSLNLGGGTSWIRDQVYLPRGSASNEEVLVRQRQLATSYSYQMFFGISYSFGSIFSNVVNPRMGGSGGMTIHFY